MCFKYIQGCFFNIFKDVFKTIFKGKRKLIAGFNFFGKEKIGSVRDTVWYQSIGGAYSVRGWNIPTKELYTSETQEYRFGFITFGSSFELRKTIIPFLKFIL